jgi:hypothetical protein
MLTGVTFPPGDYLFEATLTHASGPTTPANYLWAIVLVLKDGDQNDLPTDKRLAETLHFEKNGTGADSAIVTMPSLKNLSPPATDPTVELASADYSRVTATSHPAIDFTLRFRLDFGGGTGDATVAVNQLPGLGGTSTEYLRHGTIDGPARSVSYGTAGVLVNLARGDGMTASVILKDFKIFQI